VLAVAVSILLFGKREHFHRQHVPALKHMSYHANVFLAEIRKRYCESI